MFDKRAEKLEKVDSKVFEELFKKYFLSLTSFARKYTGDLDEAKDIVHQVFTNLWDKRENLHLNTSLRSYLYTSVYNRCLNFIRDHKKFIREDMPENIHAMHVYIDNQNLIEKEELRNKIHHALNELPQACKNIFIASKFEGKKYKEIAEEHQISIKTVESQMSKALKILREKLAEYMLAIIIIICFFL